MQEAAIVELETRLAEVMSLADLNTQVLDHLQSTLGATGTWLYSFGHSARGIALGGSLQEPMSDYTQDIYMRDPLQAYARSIPSEVFLSNVHGDFDAQGYLKSAAHWEFYRPRSIMYVQAVLPTGLPFGARHMFGISIVMNDLNAYANTMVPMLRHVEAPFRAAARRIMRFRGMEAERDVLRLASARGGMCAIWDESANLLWCSPEGAQAIDASGFDTLAAAADLALRQWSGPSASLDECVLGRPITLSSRYGEKLLVELSCAL